jgi:hypothetical protein
MTVNRSVDYWVFKKRMLKRQANRSPTAGGGRDRLRANCGCLIWLAFLLGCSQISVIGLQPEYPPVRKTKLSLFSDYVTIDTLMPTFRWQSFPRTADKTLRLAMQKGQLHAITYELRVWKTTPGPPGKLVYKIDGIKVPYHAIETPLRPSTRYLWSVRAHFLMNDRPRVTEWSLAGFALRNESVPNLSCFRFRTPANHN